MSEELVTIETTPLHIMKIYSEQGGLDPILLKAHEAVAIFEHDLSTASSRKLTASLAMKVRKLKTQLDGWGKTLTAEWKEKSKAVDVNRKAMRDELDVLAATARKPLDEWEAEQERIKQEAMQLAIDEALVKVKEEQAKQLVSAHEMGLLMNTQFDRDAEDEYARLWAEQKERDDHLTKLATENANRRAADEKQRLIDAEKNAQEQRKKEKRRRIMVEKQAKIDIEQAAERAKQNEIDRQQREQARLVDEQEERKADFKHRKDYNHEIHEALLANGLRHEQAIDIIKAIVDGRIPHTTITY